MSADELFAQSCKEFRGDAAITLIMDGFGRNDIEHVKNALALAKHAAAVDPAKYGTYAESFQGFAEGLGQFVAVQNDPQSSTQDVMAAIEKIPFPKADPECPPDSEGLPMPSDSATSTS